MPSDLQAQLGRRLLVSSGALGTALRSRGAVAGEPVELLNLRQPATVRALHQAYREAGSNILVTNTFAANPLALREAGFGERRAEVNRAGVDLARTVAGDACLVWASIGPLELGFRRDDYTLEELTSFYSEQCHCLTGADALLLETFTDPREAAAAIQAAAASGIPFVFQTGNLGGGSDRWQRLDPLIQMAVDAGAIAIGTNCGHPHDTLDTVRHLGSLFSLPITASANAGHPSLERGVVRYEFAPADFGRSGLELLMAGAAVVGGCCGTTPEHLRELAQSIGGKPLPARAAISAQRHAAPVVNNVPAARANRIRHVLESRKIVISVEIRADRKRSLEQIIAGAKIVAAAGVDLFNVPDNPGATVGRDAMVVAAKLQEKLGVPAICHMAVTQSNLLRVHSALLGCWDLELDGILAVTGDPPSMGHLGGMAKLVSDLRSSVELLRLVRDLRGGKMINGEAIAAAPDFCAGCGFARPTPPQLAWLRKKIAAGAEFVFSQPVFSRADFRQLQESLNSFPVRFFPGIMPLTSRKQAEALAEGRIPGIRVPAEVVASFQRLDTAAAQRQFGLEQAAELAGVVAREAGSLYLIMPFGRNGDAEAAEIVRAVRAARDETRLRA